MIYNWPAADILRDQIDLAIVTVVANVFDMVSLLFATWRSRGHRFSLLEIAKDRIDVAFADFDVNFVISDKLHSPVVVAQAVANDRFQCVNAVKPTINFDFCGHIDKRPGHMCERVTEWPGREVCGGLLAG